MARQTIKSSKRTRTRYRKSKTKPRHCPTCGKFMGRKK